ncbi:hypothetical protein D3C81_1806640 [compost metagenome]
MMMQPDPADMHMPACGEPLAGHTPGQPGQGGIRDLPRSLAHGPVQLPYQLPGRVTRFGPELGQGMDHPVPGQHNGIAAYRT